MRDTLAQLQSVYLSPCLLLLFCLSALTTSCGRESSEPLRAFTGDTSCLDSNSFDCGCVVLNAPLHQQKYGLTVLKCPFHENYDQAVGNSFCLNRDAETGAYREKLSLSGCPWSETKEEETRLLHPGN